MKDPFRAHRLHDFRKRADAAPANVYRHRTYGWEYIPIHPFGDEQELLKQLGMQPEDCRSADAWWSVGDDATLLESSVVGYSEGPPRLIAKATSHEERWVYLAAVLDEKFVTRSAFEAVMIQFAKAGFPSAPCFQLHWRDPPQVRLGKQWDQ